MSLIVNPKLQTPFATQFGSWLPGEEIREKMIDISEPELGMRKIPRSFLDNWIEQGHVVVTDSAPETEELADDDVLTPLNRHQLLGLIRPNGLADKIKPTTKWSDENIRQAIRDLVPDLSSLQLPAEVAEAI